MDAKRVINTLRQAKEGMFNLAPSYRKKRHFGKFQDASCPCTVCEIDRLITELEQDNQLKGENNETRPKN